MIHYIIIGMILAYLTLIAYAVYQMIRKDGNKQDQEQSDDFII